MILSRIRDYLAQRGQATLGDIALHFDTDPQAMRGMLDVLVRKGKVQRRSLDPACGSGCSKCDVTVREIYHVTGS